MEPSNQGTQDGTKPKTTNPRERNDKEDNRQNRDKNINRNFREEMQQRKPPSHKSIKKSARKISSTIYLYRIVSYNFYNCWIFREKKIGTVIKRTEKIYNTRYPCCISSVFKCVKIANLRLRCKSKFCYHVKGLSF